MNVVTNNFMLKYFKQIKIFKLDLGTNLKGPVSKKRQGDGENSIRIRDEFVKKYQTLNNNSLIRKYGEIGRLKFYEDGNIKGNDFHVYNDGEIYEIVASSEDLSKDPSIYLTEILQMLENKPDDEDIEDIEQIKDVTYTNMPEDLDRPNMKMPRDQYIESLVNRRNFMEKINKN